MRSHSVLLPILTLLISQAFSVPTIGTTPIAAGTFCPSQHNKCIVGATNGVAFTTRCGYQTSGGTPAFATNSTGARDCINQCDAASDCVRAAYFGVQDGTMPYNCEGHTPATQGSSYRYSGGTNILFDSLTVCTGGRIASSVNDAASATGPESVSSSVRILHNHSHLTTFPCFGSGNSGRCWIELFPNSFRHVCLAWSSERDILVCPYTADYDACG